MLLGICKGKCAYEIAIIFGYFVESALQFRGVRLVIVLT
jgi:hypothetical protein